MKNQLLTLCILVICIHANAQKDTSQNKMSPPNANQIYQEIPKYSAADGYMMIDDKMVAVKEGKTSPMENDVTLENGIIVSKNGNYYQAGKAKQMLREGEHIDMDGNCTPHHSQKSTQIK